jgi:type IV pilus assembly protein PilF
MKRHFTNPLVISLVFLAGCASSNRDVDQASRYHAPNESQQIPSGPTKADYAASAQVNLELAAAYLQSGRYGVALEVINRSLLADPTSATAIALQGLIYGEMKDFDHGDASFRRALALDPKNADINHNYGTFLCREGREEASLAYFETAVSVPAYRNAPNSYAAAGNCLVRLGRTKEAETQFNNALRLDQGHGQALIGIANLEYSRGQYTVALSTLNRYEQLRERTAESIWMKLRTERQLGNRNEVAGLSADLERLFPKSAELGKLRNGEF